MTALIPSIAFILKEGAANANFLWIGVLVTVLSVATFVAWMAYALFSRSELMESAANLPFDDLDGGAE